MKKIIVIVSLCFLSILAGCGDKTSQSPQIAILSSSVSNSSAIEGNFVSSNHAVDSLIFKTDGSVLLSTKDGSNASLRYTKNGDTVTIPGLVPSEYHFDKDGHLANNMNRTFYARK